MKGLRLRAESDGRCIALSVVVLAGEVVEWTPKAVIFVAERRTEVWRTKVAEMHCDECG
jgi:hypothetical protein